MKGELYNKKHRGKWFLVSIEQETKRYKTPDGQHLFTAKEAIRLLETYDHCLIMAASANTWNYKYGAEDIPGGYAVLHQPQET